MICNKIIPIDKPYQFTTRHDSAVGAALISALGSAAASAISSSSANSAATNLNFENRLWNEIQMQKQNAYNYQMWNEANQYNSPVEQRKRLQAAGFNPYLAMLGDTGTAQSLQSASPGSASMNAQQQSFDFSSIGNTLANVGLNAAMARKANAEAAGQEKANQWIDARTQAEINNIISNTEYTKGNKLLNDVRRNLEDFSLQKSKMMLVGDLAQQDLTNQSLAENIINQRANTLYTSVQTSLAETNLKWLPKQYEAQISNYAAQTFAAIEAGKLSQKQGLAAVANAMLSTAQANGQNINNKILRKSANFAVSKMFWDAKKSKFDANTSFWNSRHSKANSGPDDLFRLVNGHNGYSGSGNAWFNFLEGIRRFVPMSH